MVAGRLGLPAETPRTPAAGACPQQHDTPLTGNWPPWLPCPCHAPHAAREFRETLEDLNEDVSGLTAEVEHLEKFIVDTISFEVGWGG